MDTENSSLKAASAYWQYGLAILVAGFVLGWFLHQPAAPISQRATTASSDVERQTETRKDSSALELTVKDRAIPVRVAPAHLPSARGEAIGPGPCPKFTLPPVFILDVDSTGVYTLAIDTIDAVNARVSGIRLSHTMEFSHAADTTRKLVATHEHVGTDSVRHTSDSVTRETIVADPSLFRLQAFGEVPVLSDGAIGFQIVQARVGFVASMKVLMASIYARPEIEVLTASFRQLKIEIGASFDLYKSGAY